HRAARGARRRARLGRRPLLVRPAARRHPRRAGGLPPLHPPGVDAARLGRAQPAVHAVPPPLSESAHQPTSTRTAWPCPTPMQAVATPSPPPRRRSSRHRSTTTRGNEAPSGWPIAMAPPLTFTRSRSIGGRPSSVDRTIAAKASLTSHRSMSVWRSPARSSSFATAGTGATLNRSGSTATVALPRTRPSGATPSRSATSLVPTRAASAPSLIGEELPAVTATPGRSPRPWPDAAPPPRRARTSCRRRSRRSGPTRPSARSSGCSARCTAPGAPARSSDRRSGVRVLPDHLPLDDVLAPGVRHRGAGEPEPVPLVERDRVLVEAAHLQHDPASSELPGQVLGGLDEPVPHAEPPGAGRDIHGHEGGGVLRQREVHRALGEQAEP